MSYSKPEVVALRSAVELIQQSISAKPTNQVADLNVGYTDPTTSNAYEADE